MLLTCLPYAFVWLLEPGDGLFPGLLFSSDDAGVYLAWLRQAADGRLFFKNLFTPEAQTAALPNLYFLLLGQLGRLGAPLPVLYHIGRVIAGWAALILLYRLTCELAPGTDDAARFRRGCAYWTAVLAGGLGWVRWERVIRPDLPVDAWQPEAFMLPSLYVNGLWAASLALMLGVVLCLLRAEREGMRWALGAGLCGAVLGIIHSYDVIHLALAWTCFLGVRWIVEGRLPGALLRRSLAAAAVALPSVLYMAWLYSSERVFRSRADVETLTPGLSLYLWGFGLMLPFALAAFPRLLPAAAIPRQPVQTAAAAAAAVAAGVAAFSNWPGMFAPLLLLAYLLWRRPAAGLPPAALLLPAWLAGGFAAAYLPFAFQRKMIMGVQIPLGLLAGLGVAACGFEWVRRRKPAGGGSAPPLWLPAALIALLAISPVLFMVRDMQSAREENLTSTRLHPAYWRRDVLDTYRWIGKHTPPDAVVLALPTHAVLLPAYGGRAVYAGHWGETPDYGDRLNQALLIYGGQPRTEELARAIASYSSSPPSDPSTRAAGEGSPTEAFSRLRLQWLQANGVTHVVWGPYEAAAAEPGPVPLTAEPYLRPIHRTGEVTVYEVAPS